MSDLHSAPASFSPASVAEASPAVPANAVADEARVKRPELDPTRYGDWEKNGRCIDF